MRQLELASGFGIHADPGPINCSDGAGKTYGGHPIGAYGDCIHDMLVQECPLDGLVMAVSEEPAATNMNNKLLSNFIFEVGDGRRKTSVGRHIGIANETEP